MKYLRLTHWPTIDGPTTMVLGEDSMTVPPLEAVEGMLNAGLGFFTYEVFDTDATSIVEATIEAQRRVGDDDRNMAIAYIYYVQALGRLTPGGTMASTEAPPLSREQVAWVLRSVAHDEAYQDQRFIIPMSDGTTIEMEKGEVLPS